MSIRSATDLNMQQRWVTNLATPGSASDAATKGYVDARQLGSIATSTTAIGTLATAVTGLSLTSVPAGTYSIYMWVPFVTVGTVTTLQCTVSPSSGPTTSSLRMAAIRAISGSAPLQVQFTAFNSAQTIGVSLAAGTYLLEIQGGMVSTSSGTINLSMTRVGGTSATVQIGSYIRLERFA